MDVDDHSRTKKEEGEWHNIGRDFFEGEIVGRRIGQGLHVASNVAFAGP